MAPDLEEYREIARRCRNTEACAAIIELGCLAEDLQQEINNLEEDANKTKAQHTAMLEALETAANLISDQRDVLVADPDHDPALAAAAVIIRRRIQRAIKEAQ